MTMSPAKAGANRRFVRMIDLADDTAAIAAYEAAHSPGNTPAEVLALQRRHGIVELEIYRLGTRLVMLMEVDATFDPEGLDRETAADPVLIEWQRRMGALQRPLPGHSGWAELPCIFRQSDHP
ncbi:L-rhamnose mutarotase [Sphingomonas sanguinis]|uniref:L-rhamnose mutarotase n=1 Tax=Sphingomonas sanguinis TaxID=33051 RepID=UPI001C5737F2|nr:L-rhamnose mutarotase [Sphingomonas sanguinis]QXT35516.1 L-rhamnose mutarotase [Sphingomonas sanguinis]